MSACEIQTPFKMPAFYGLH